MALGDRMRSGACIYSGGSSTGHRGGEKRVYTIANLRRRLCDEDAESTALPRPGFTGNHFDPQSAKNARPLVGAADQITITSWQLCRDKKEIRENEMSKFKLGGGLSLLLA